MTHPVTLEAIYTFTDGPQQIARLPLSGLTSEANALHAVLSELSASERQSLLKLSLCLYGDDLADWAWLEESHGKYYFTATAPKPKPERRIHPDLVAAFKSNPSNETANAIFEAITPALGVVVLAGATLSDGPMAGLVIKDCIGRFVVHIGRDGRLNAVPDSAPAAEPEPKPEPEPRVSASLVWFYCDFASRAKDAPPFDTDHSLLEDAENRLTRAFAKAIGADVASVATYGQFIARPDGSIDVLKQGGALGWRIAPDGTIADWHQWEARP